MAFIDYDNYIPKMWDTLEILKESGKSYTKIITPLHRSRSVYLK